MTKTAKIIGLISGVVFALCVVIWVQASRDHDQLRKDLSDRGVVIEGIIFEKKGGYKSRVSFYYYFHVNNIEYNGDFGGYISSDYQIGDTIQLEYDPLDPSRNEKIKPPSITSTKDKLILAAWFIIPMLFLLLYVRYIFKKDSNE